MKINFDATLHDEQGCVINLGSTEEPKSATLSWIACQALLATYPGESIGGEEKHRRFKMWQQLKDGGDIEIKIEDAALIKRLIGLGAIPIICGQAYDLLEGA